MEHNKNSIRTAIFGAMGCIVLYWLLHEPERIRGWIGAGVSLMAPFLVGSCLAFVLNVPMRAIERFLKKEFGMKNTRGLAILLTSFVILMVISFVVYLLIPQLEDTVRTLRRQIPYFLERAEELLYQLMRDHPQIRAWILDYTDFENMDWTGLLQQAGDLMGESLSSIFGSAVSAVGNVISGVWSVFVSIVFCFYCLGNKEQLARQARRILYAVLPERWSDEIIRIFRLTNSTFSNFFSGQCLEVCILGSMFAVTMTIFRMPYVSLVSVLVAVTAFIPIVGATIGCVFGAFFILVNDPLQAAGFVVMFLVLQQIENNLIYPRVVGSSVGLPSMWTLFSVTIGGELMGVAGMVLMIPLVSVVYTLIGDYTGRLVRLKGIAPEKLTDQPPELKSRLKEKREIKRQKREAKRAAQLAEMMKRSLHLPEHEDSENKS